MSQNNIRDARLVGLHRWTQRGKPQPKEGNHEWTRMNTNPKEEELNGHKKAQRGLRRNHTGKFFAKKTKTCMIVVRMDTDFRSKGQSV